MYLLGYDIGSSAIKGAIIEASTQQVIASSHYPTSEMEMLSKQDGWAEQDPELWWRHLKTLTSKLLSTSYIDPTEIKGIGIAYQMHGLVLIDKDQRVLRPAIIWCDSRAVEIGNKAKKDLYKSSFYPSYLNGPGNFTASKLSWVKQNESEIYKQVDKFLLPGDYIAMKLTGEVKTTLSGLSEGILWNFKKHQPGFELLEYFGIEKNKLATLCESFEVQGKINESAASETGLAIGTPITYRAGDQPNNALSLGVFKPGQLAGSGGTSGVVYAIMDQLNYDEEERINSFAHINHTETENRIGALLCINGAGIQYAWLKNQIAEKGISYEDMEQQIQQIPIGSDGLQIIPFGNGAERMLGNKNIGAQILNLQFNKHKQVHLFRAGLEGIAFSFVYGINILKKLGVKVNTLKVGRDNLFQSKIFSQTIASLTDVDIEIIETNGAIGAAKAAGIGIEYYKNMEEAFSANKILAVFKPQKNDAYKIAYLNWENELENILKRNK